MSLAFYVLCWLLVSAFAILLLWYVAERAPLMDDGWQDHDSDRCPVEPLTRVDVLFDNGSVLYDTHACMWYWATANLMDGGMRRIVAYRVREVQA